MKILVTGASGCVAAALLPSLAAQTFVESITGVDRKAAAFTDDKYRHVQLDMRDATLKDVMAGHDAVIHLGFIVAQEKLTEAEMRDINVEGSANVVNAALTAGVRKFINMSSISVYGSGENMDESMTPRPPRWFPYAQHKLLVEHYIQQHMPDAIQFRAHLIVGGRARKFLREIFLLPVWLDFGTHPPKQQVVHEDDVVDAVIAGLQTDVRGLYNLAAPDVIQLGGDYIRQGIKEGRKIRRMRFGVVRAIANVGRLFIQKDLLTLISMLDTTSTVTCAKTTRDLGWRAKRSAWDARTDALKSLGKA
ncbi:NAD-dependent epimerase/dehydratase family protein [Rhodanobacter sp. FW106-PBR-LB-2-11]|uniref:NAD-dependent epimerase/dehydratase family protein n=1 Tax=Rhodanobacter sp. FW106-PBR-LB-2-11 TaxID=1524463 RepID=UPI0034E3C1C8